MPLIYQNYIFAGMSPYEVKTFSLMCDQPEFSPWEIIFQEGDEGNGMCYIIDYWEVKVMKNGEEITRIGMGDIFGEIALVTDTNRTATIIATEMTKVFSFSKDEFIALAKKSPKYKEIQREILRRIWGK